MIKIIYQGNDFNKIERDILKAFDFVYKYFLLEIPSITVIVCTSRLEFDKYLKMKTEAWLVANASDNNEIAILSPQVLEEDSSHSANDFLPILKHEFTHLFVDGIAKGKTIPKWLDEGVAAYIAKQHQQENEVVDIKEGFCRKLSTSNDWYRNVNKGAYTTAAWFVNFLINNYSFEEIIQLIKSLNKQYNYQSFVDEFFNIYKASLNDVEKKFIKSHNGQN